MGRPRKVKEEAPTPEALTMEQVIEMLPTRLEGGKRPPLMPTLVKWGSATN